MFIHGISGSVIELLSNDQTHFQCTLTLTIPLRGKTQIEPGTLVAAENLLSTKKEQRFTILQILTAFPTAPEKKAKVDDSTVTMICKATPLGVELFNPGGKGGTSIQAADTFPNFDAEVFVLDDSTIMDVIHQIAPESRSKEHGARIDIGAYRTNPNVKAGLDPVSLVRGNIAVISSRPRARTTITNNLINALLKNTALPMHVVYCDVNNQSTLSLTNQISTFDNTTVLALNDKFVPSSVFYALRNLSDRQAHKRAVLDYLDMMILPSVLEQRRHNFTYAVSGWFRSNKVSIYRPNEQTVDQFIRDISIDILDGAESDVSEFLTSVMSGIAETYKGERFSEKNIKDILEMLDEFSQDSKNHTARRVLYDLRGEIQSVFESYSKDIPPLARKSLQDVVTSLNDETKSSFLVVQGQKTTDILRFVSTLTQALVEERLRRLKIRVPILFIFNNIDEYIIRNGASREAGSDRFQDTLQVMLQNGRRHGLGFCLTLESAASLELTLARKIQSYFVGPIPFTDEPPIVSQLLNVSEEMLRPAVNYEDGSFLFASVDSQYHRRVPLPIIIPRNTEIIHAFLDEIGEEQEKRKKEYQQQEEERSRRYAKEREERGIQPEEPRFVVAGVREPVPPAEGDSQIKKDTYKKLKEIAERKKLAAMLKEQQRTMQPEQHFEHEAPETFSQQDSDDRDLPSTPEAQSQDARSEQRNKSSRRNKSGRKHGGDRDHRDQRVNQSEVSERTGEHQDRIAHEPTASPSTDAHRPPRPEMPPRQPRPDMSQRPPRPEEQQRTPRPETQQRQPRPEMPPRPPRPEEPQRTPRPEMPQRQPRPEMPPRPPRPEESGESRPDTERQPRPQPQRQPRPEMPPRPPRPEESGESRPDTERQPRPQPQRQPRPEVSRLPRTEAPKPEHVESKPEPIEPKVKKEEPKPEVSGEQETPKKKAARPRRTKKTPEAGE